MMRPGPGRTSRRWRRTAALTLACIVASLDAQDLEPRVYASTPVGMRFLLSGYSFTSGNVLSDAASSVPPTDWAATFPPPG